MADQSFQNVWFVFCIEYKWYPAYHTCCCARVSPALLKGLYIYRATFTLVSLWFSWHWACLWAGGRLCVIFPASYSDQCWMFRRSIPVGTRTALDTEAKLWCLAIFLPSLSLLILFSSPTGLQKCSFFHSGLDIDH